ncbi:MAG TPA: hypothetical protein VII28_04070 [Puia sp.]
MNRISKFVIVFIFGFVLGPASGLTQPDIPINPDLKSNCESWKIKVKQNGIWGKKPAMISFGQLKTISTETEKSGQSSKQVDRELFWKNIRTVNSSESSMALELNGTDTATISMLTVKEEITKEKNVAGTLTHVNRDDEELYHVSSWIDEMILQFQNDSTSWHYSKWETGSTFGVLEKIQDTSVKVFLLKVNNLEGKKMKEMMFSQPALGFVFEYQGKQVAAFQTLMKQMIWVSNGLDPLLRKAILATAAAVMATVKSGGSNGF